MADEKVKEPVEKAVEGLTSGGELVRIDRSTLL